ncbi:DUF5812 family protein [Haladaptatus pallidirubidus]|uniref:DUF5812 family protein n=1 Tax=Haladaptatus pallidirubidus TaxID=1008152 RepID=A0AAV3UES3_9EURY|nr:DUF5812 family protein [Haladaptatus pallidirubidus]
MTEKTSTFLVTHAEEESAVLKDVHDGQVHALSENPGVETHDAVDATVAAEPPMEMTWEVVEIDDQRPLRVHESEEPPTVQERDIAEEQEIGDLERTERAGIGEIHVLSVSADETDAAVSDVLEDEGTLARAARLGVNRVEIRSEDGVVSVRYLP